MAASMVTASAEHAGHVEAYRVLVGEAADKVRMG